VIYRIDSFEAIKRVYKQHKENKIALGKAKIVSLAAYKKIKRERELIHKLLISKRKQEILDNRG